jgi:hypothetical protein
VGPYVSPHMRFTHAPVTAFSIFYLLDGAKNLVRFYIYILPVCVPGAVSFDDACACSRALQALPRLREHLATCRYRYIGVSLTVQVQEEIDTPRNVPFSWQSRVCLRCAGTPSLLYFHYKAIYASTVTLQKIATLKGRRHYRSRPAFLRRRTVAYVVSLS